MTALSSIVAIVLLGVPTVLANLGLRRRWARIISLVWIGVFAGLVALEGLLIFGLLSTATAPIQGDPSAPARLTGQASGPVLAAVVVLMRTLIREMDSP